MRDHKQIVAPILKDVEGTVPYYYCDSMGNVTCCAGHLVTYQEAEREGLQDDWKACKAFYKSHPGCVATAYEAVTDHRFTADEIHNRLILDIIEIDRQAVQLIPGYAVANLALALLTLELCFHLGVTKVLNTYPRFLAALYRNDITAALLQIGRGKEHDYRVAMMHGAVYVLTA